MASVTRGNRTGRDRRETARSRIVAAVNDLLARGERFTEIPVERLLQESGVSRSTFYVHFADKSALLLAIADDAVRDVIATAGKGLGSVYEPDVPSVAIGVSELIATYRRHAAVLATIREVGAYDDEVREFWSRRRSEFCRLAAGHLREEQRRGSVPATVDVDIVCELVAQLTDGAILEHIRHGSPDGDHALAVEIARIGWLACYGPVPQ